MSARVQELYADRVQTIESSGKYTSLELSFLAEDVVMDSDVVLINNVAYPASTEHFALEAVRAFAPRKIYGMSRQELRIAEKINETAFKVAVTYGYSGSSHPGSEDDDVDVGDRTITFSGAAGTRRITHSFKTLEHIGDAPDQDGAINVDSEHNIHGVDVLDPSLSFSETHYMTYKKFKISYIRDLNALQGKVNNEQFRGFEAGEVRFDGFSAHRRGTKRDDLYEVTFNFSVIPNQPAREIHGLDIPAKQGWDYIWFRTRKEEKVDYAPPDSPGGQGAVTSKVVGAYIERVYQRGNFGKLKIKTTPFVPVGEDEREEL